MTRLPMRILTTSGVVAIPNLSDADASIAGTFENALKRYWSTGDTDVLQPFHGVQLAGHTLETDPETLNWWGMTGEAGYESIYEGGL